MCAPCPTRAASRSSAANAWRRACRRPASSIATRARPWAGKPKDGAGYDELAGRTDFKEALDRLVAGSADTTLCLMCAEKEPLDCHRTVLVSRRLAERGAAIEHLLADGKHKPHAVLEEELLGASGEAVP